MGPLYVRKRKFEDACKLLPYFIKMSVPKRDVGRYSDKYNELQQQEDTDVTWDKDWGIPDELIIKVKPNRRNVRVFQVPIPLSTDDVY